MKRRTSAIMLIGFGMLVVLVAVLGIGAQRRADRIESEIAGIHEKYRQSALLLGKTKEDSYRASVSIRDYLLDPSPDAIRQYKGKLVSIMASQNDSLDALSRMIGRDEAPVLERLRHEVKIYWDSLEPVFGWKSEDKSALASSFLRMEITPRRKAVFSIVQEIDELSAGTFRHEQENINARRREFKAYLSRMIAVSVFSAIGIAAISIFSVTVLSRRSESQRLRAENAEKGLRRLSQQLVQAQEEERKSISRELHDEIGQMLTGLKMELGNLETLYGDAPEDFKIRLTETKAITEQTMRSVRDMAMGLRPSMLDDLGLEPALRWHAKEFQRHSGILTSVETDGNLQDLSEAVRTCIYRVVQESLTNCARHADAHNVRIAVHGGKDRINLTIQDDGKGFDRRKTGGSGLGLIGMEERVKKIGGSLIISSHSHESQRGTILNVELPVSSEVPS